MLCVAQMAPIDRRMQIKLNVVSPLRAYAGLMGTLLIWK
jgi:hypothetical protein